MGRTSESLQHALIMRVLPKIQNKKTGTAYKKHIKSFSKWAREHGYRRPDQITKDVIQEYEQHLEGSPKGYSPATIHAYLSPVCSAADVNMEEIRKPKRTAGSIIRGRRRNTDGQGDSRNRQGDRQEHNPKYTRLVSLQRVIGIRRAELARLTGADLIERGHSLYVRVIKGKGGKNQMQYVLPQDEQIVREIFDGVDPDQKVFSKEEMNNTINLHGMRAQHGRDCYQHYMSLITTKQGAADNLRQTLLKRWEKGHERLRASDQKAWERQRARFVADCDDRPYRLRGENLAKAQALGLPEEYNRLALMCVSVWHLSHWRLDVTVTNYIIG